MAGQGGRHGAGGPRLRRYVPDSTGFPAGHFDVWRIRNERGSCGGPQGESSGIPQGVHSSVKTTPGIDGRAVQR